MADDFFVPSGLFLFINGLEIFVLLVKYNFIIFWDPQRLFFSMDTPIPGKRFSFFFFCTKFQSTTTKTNNTPKPPKKFPLRLIATPRLCAKQKTFEGLAP